MKQLADGGFESAGPARGDGRAIDHVSRLPWRTRPGWYGCRGGLLLFAALCLAACESVEPRAPNIDAGYLMAHAPGTPSASVTNVDQARQLLDGFRAVLEGAATDRFKREDVINELTFYGTLVAVIGIAAKSIAARNIGAGVAGISATVDGHYKLDKQSKSFITAYNRATCVLTALNGIDLKTYALFDGKPLDAGNDLKLDDAYAQIPGQTLGAIQSITTLLQADLANISLASGNLSDIQKTASAVMSAADAAKKIGPQPASEPTVNNLAATQNRVALRLTFAGTPATAADREALAAQQQAAAAAAVAAAAESAKKTVFLKSVAQFATSSAACTKPSS